MATEEAALRSPLEKPLKDLTEEDISQLTREDCRRFLKQKGMRRPSWNKSQAIQQVISLKTLLEARPEPDTPAHASSPSSSSPSPSLRASSSADAQIPASNSESVPDRGKDASQTTSPSEPPHCPPAGDNVPPSSPAANEPAPGGQMTIFYCGKVNVYEGVSAEKARAIMLLAGSPDCFPAAEASSAGPSAGCRQSGVVSPLSRENAEEGKNCSEQDGPTGRKASLQRYLEKRKDRGRFKVKRKCGGTLSSNMEMFLTHHGRGNMSNEQSSRSGTSSPTQPRPPLTPTRNSTENQVKNLRFPVDLNDDVQES